MGSPFDQDAHRSDEEPRMKRSEAQGSAGKRTLPAESVTPPVFKSLEGLRYWFSVRSSAHSKTSRSIVAPAAFTTAPAHNMLTRQESTTPSVLKTGTLLKEGTSPPWNWHSRHFILEDSCLKCAAGHSTADFGLTAATPHSPLLPHAE